MIYQRLEFSVKSRVVPPPKHAVEDLSTYHPQGPRWCDAGGTYRDSCGHCKDIDARVAMSLAADLSYDEELRWLVGRIPGLDGPRPWDLWWSPV